MKTLPFFIGVLCCITSCTHKADVQQEYTFTPEPVDLTISQQGEKYFVKGASAFQIDNHFVWGASVTKAEDGKYYMIFSAPEAGIHPFNNAWVFGSKMGLAVSDFPDRDFKHLGFFMNADGFKEERTSWDAQSVSNPHVRKFGDTYYLYYVGSVDPLQATIVSETGELPRRDRIQQNQQIGVITFKSFPDLLDNKYTHYDKPLLSPRTRVKSNNVINPSPVGTQVKPDNLIVVNPAVVYRPTDGKYLLYFKGNIYDPHWRGIHGVAISDSPTGPFEPLDTPVFTLENVEGNLSAEDPYVWYHSKDQCFYAVFKDFNGQFTKGDPCLAIMSSKDGIHWNLPKNSMFMQKKLILKDGTTINVNRLERPQLLLDESGDPLVLYAACSIGELNSRVDGGSFNVQIRINSHKVPVSKK